MDLRSDKYDAIEVRDRWPEELSVRRPPLHAQPNTVASEHLKTNRLSARTHREREPRPAQVNVAVEPLTSLVPWGRIGLNVCLGLAHPAGAELFL